MFVKKRVPVKDIGPLIPGNCTESQGGPNGAIPGPPKKNDKTKTKKKCELGLAIEITLKVGIWVIDGGE